MNSNEILNKYINLINKGYCSDCNELNCIDNFPHSKITHAIRELQQENKILKDNWNKLKEYLNYKSERAVGEDEYVYDEIYNEMQELEQGSDNDDRYSN